VAAGQVGHERRQPIVFAVQPAVLDSDFLALDVAGFVEGFTERTNTAHGGLLRLSVDEADHRHRRLLRARVSRPRCRCAAEQCDEVAPFQLIELHPLPLASVTA
jgi:hypothetical protein